MIKREVYMQRIRPFMNTELIKVFTGIRRAGKSVMLELVKNELKESGIGEENFLCINFEQFSNSQFLDVESLYKKITDFQKNTKKSRNHRRNNISRIDFRKIPYIIFFGVREDRLWMTTAVIKMFWMRKNSSNIMERPLPRKK